MVSIFDRTLCYLHTNFYMCFSDFWYDSPHVPAYHWTRGRAFFFRLSFFVLFVHCLTSTFFSYLSLITIVAVISFCVIEPNIQFMLSQVTLNTSTYFGIFDIFSSPSGGGGHRRRCRRCVILGRGSRCTTNTVHKSNP
jgi:hypothetical protein